MTIRHMLLLGLAAVLATPLAAQSRPDFSGTWKLNLENAPPDAPRSVIVKIDHKEPALKYTAAGETSNGDSFSESAEFTTDGKEFPFRPELQGVISARWEGQTLVIRADLKAIPLTQTARTTLSGDGNRMTRDITETSGQGENKRKEVYDREQKR